MGRGLARVGYVPVIAGGIAASVELWLRALGGGGSIGAPVRPVVPRSHGREVPVVVAARPRPHHAFVVPQVLAPLFPSRAAAPTPAVSAFASAVAAAQPAAPGTPTVPEGRSGSSPP